MAFDRKFIRRTALAAAAFVALGVAQTSAFADPPLPGAIFTAAAPATVGGPCTTVNSNIYLDKGSVYLNGGPDHPSAAGLLPNTSYYVQVTNPNGAAVLGTSVLNSPLSQRPVATDAYGKFVSCYHLIDIVSTSFGVPGYLDTPNNGGEYKVWVSTESNFVNNSTKTDNFKVSTGRVPPEDVGRITIKKFYDANANGVQDGTEPDIVGWKVDLLGYAPKSTQALYDKLSDDAYAAEEYTPIQTNWYATAVTVTNGGITTTPSNSSSTPVILNAAPVTLVSPNSNDALVSFGNVCTGAGHGFTLGFWSNQNGQAAMNQVGMGNALSMLGSLNLRDPKGNDFNPASYPAFRTWLLNGNAVNMAYMLSVQLAAMELNVYTGRVDGNALIYAPGTGAGPLTTGFASVADVMTAANASLGGNGYTVAGVPLRSYQEYLKNALDNANNNRTFVQGAPCAFSFNNPVVVAP
jgi:hypothetical protein